MPDEYPAEAGEAKEHSEHDCELDAVLDLAGLEEDILIPGGDWNGLVHIFCAEDVEVPTRIGAVRRGLLVGVFQFLRERTEFDWDVSVKLTGGPIDLV